MPTSPPHGLQLVNRQSKLEPRYRELMILRTGWNCRSEYEWAQHVGSVGRAREMGMPVDNIARGPDAPGWNPTERALLTAADELYRDSFVSDRTWSALSAGLDTVMIVNALISAANYRLVSMSLNAFGVKLEPGDERFPTIAN
jgi:alkylhydroperoxidase family enzyme